MATDRLRVGFVGAGAIVRQRHVPGLRALPDVELAGVANRSRASSERASRELGLGRVYDDWRQLVESDEVDLVWIGTHPYMHREITLASLAAGKHVFCQARMAMDYADAKLMWAAAEESDLTTMLCPPPSYLSGDRVVRRLLAEGFVGRPLNVLIQSYSDTYADPAKPRHWRQEWARSGYNTLDLGMMIEVMHRWLGYARRITAVDLTAYSSRPDPAGGQIPVERPDAVTAVAELENGALATIAVSGVARHAGDANRFEIYGTDGTIRYLAASNTILTGKIGGALEPLPVTLDETRDWTVEADFIRAVREGRRSTEPSFWDGLKYMELTEAIFRSAQTGQVTPLPFDDLHRP